ncbi:hypothetical protein Dimus_036509 [Dionaea muscipula]
MSISPPYHHLLQGLHVKSTSPSVSGTEFRMVAEHVGLFPKKFDFEDAKERIRKMVDKVEVSVSAYDTAWVAMVPSQTQSSPGDTDTPCFPGTMNWILDNQLQDGSWGLPHRHNLLIKDALSSTLACVLALKRWQVGQAHMVRGLDFISSNFASVMDDEKHSPIGFSIIFPSMIDYAINMGINFHLPQEDIEELLNRKDMELERIKGKSSGSRNHYLAYISEGLGKLQDWETTMTYQRKNGSLFNSPSATAAALLHLHNSRCHSYLCSVLQQFGNAVPTMYPFHTYVQLYMVDKLQRLGIDRHFTENIRNVLDETFRLWIQGHEDSFGDIATRALAFRLLRLHGYSIPSVPLAMYGDQESCFDRFGGHVKDITDALELFRASELIIDESDRFLEKQISGSRNFLRQQLNRSIQADGFAKYIIHEVEDALKNPYYASLEHIANRRCIEHYNLDNTTVHKTSFRFEALDDDVLLKLAVEDFNYCQSIHLQELKQLKQWNMVNRLDQLSFSRQKLIYCYFSAASTIFSPELAHAQEQLNLIQLVQQWGTKEGANCCSEKVHIVFYALHDTISEIGDQACRYQDRNVAGHILKEWRRLIESMWREAEMTRNKSVPTMKEYLENALISFALGPIVLPTLHLLGPKLSEEAIRSLEYRNLFESMSTCGRLLNDIRGFEREAKEGKLNAVSLHIHHGKGLVSEEEAIKDMASIIVNKRRELLGLVLQNEDSVVPRACKDLFWKMSKVLHLFYGEDDGFTTENMEGVVRRILQDPVVLA